MDKKKMSVVMIGVVLVALGVTVTASSVSHTPLYTFRMEQVSDKMNFLPTEVNGFTYTSEKGYVLNYGLTGFCKNVEPLSTLPNTSCPEETCEGSCENTCIYTCDPTCPYTCDDPTCPYTCDDPTCDPTCEYTCDPTCSSPWTCYLSTCEYTCIPTCETCFGWTCTTPTCNCRNV
jgi:hypothetical protein